MFALTCPHCKVEIKTKFARPGATVKCTQCQQTFLLDARNTREVPDPPPTGAQPNAELSSGARSQSKMAMAAMREMAEQMGDLVPEVDIYAPPPGETNTKAVKLILAICLLVVVLVGAIWLVATTPAIRDLFKDTPAKHPLPAKSTKPAYEPGARPASDF